MLTAETDVTSAKTPDEEAVRKKHEAPARRGSSMAFTIDLSDNTEAGASSSAAAPSEAFTVDFGGADGDEERRAKRLGMRDSLSQFLPTKVRQSFRNRGSKPRRQNDEQNDEVRERRESTKSVCTFITTRSLVLVSGWRLSNNR